MKETIRLYDKEPYATEFTAEVLSCEEIEKRGHKTYQVILDQTLFFPEEGGQSPDYGTLEDTKVMDVQIRKDIIYHTLDTPLEVGRTVKGKIDWTHRFSNMQQHSGEHIFSGIVHKKFGFDNVGFHLSDQVVTMDFSGVLSSEEVLAVEQEVNEAIVKNIPIEVTYPAKDALAELEYRSKIEIEGQVRIVTIPGYDMCACCAPHVRQTGEIGMLKIISMQSYKGGVRISILCGFRALQEFRLKSEIITELSTVLSSNQEALPENVTKLKNQVQSLKSQLASTKQEWMAMKIQAIPTECKDVLLFEKGLDSAVMRNTVNQLVEEREGTAAIFTGSEESGYSYIIGSKNRDCREFAALLKEKLEAKGGGSAAMIQGSVKKKEAEIREVWRLL